LYWTGLAVEYRRAAGLIGRTRPAGGKPRARSGNGASAPVPACADRARVWFTVGAEATTARRAKPDCSSRGRSGGIGLNEPRPRKAQKNRYSLRAGRAARYRAAMPAERASRHSDGPNGEAPGRTYS